MHESENPLLSSIQDIISEKFGLDSWPSAMGVNAIEVYVCPYESESYVFTICIVSDAILIYKPPVSGLGYDNKISLYDKNLEKKLFNQIEEVISNMAR